MKAQFIGRDGSLGFERDAVYDIKIGSMMVKFGSSYEEVLFVRDLNSRKVCPYASMKLLQNNWYIV